MQGGETWDLDEGVIRKRQIARPDHLHVAAWQRPCPYIQEAVAARQCPQRLLARIPHAGFDPRDVGVGDARLAELALRESALFA
jgi:hypothetical protein